MNPAPDPVAVEALRDEMDATELDFTNAKLAYYNRTDYKDAPVDFDRLTAYARRFIAASHAFQKARWGKVRIALSVSNLLRE
jgi:hypothetical protein